MMQVYSVGDIADYLRELLAGDDVLADVWVTGEITNLTRASSGHLYFSLKDDDGQIRSVMWRSSVVRCGAAPNPGDAVVVHGRFDFYPPQGTCQLVADLLYPAGIGEGQMRFEALRLKLEQEGLFAEDRKRPLPTFPQRIGLVTSESGAVYHDVITVLERRFPLAQVIFCHSAVQGDRAPMELVAALQRLIEWRDRDGSTVDCVIIGRGGGSPEELAGFNDERLARAIFAAPWPVISAVGHETDFTICDFVADHRAPTPSAAAEMVSPDLVALRLDLAELVERGRAFAEQILSATGTDLGRARDRLIAHSPLTRIARDRQATLDQQARAHLALEVRLRSLHEQLAGRRLQLAALSPRATLGRGYSIVTTADGTVARSVADVAVGDNLTVELVDGAVETAATRIIPEANSPDTPSNGAASGPTDVAPRSSTRSRRRAGER